MDWNVVLKIWAVLGPLLAAGISAVWARRNQIQDRTFNSAQQAELRKESLRDREFEFHRTTSHAKKVELTAAIATFIASCNRYMIACAREHAALATGSAESGAVNSAAEMNVQYQNVAILGTDKIAAAADALLNLAVDFGTISSELKEEQKANIAEYHKARSTLTRLSRDLLGLRE